MQFVLMVVLHQFGMTVSDVAGIQGETMYDCLLNLCL